MSDNLVNWIKIDLIHYNAVNHYHPNSETDSIKLISDASSGSCKFFFFYALGFAKDDVKVEIWIQRTLAGFLNQTRGRSLPCNIFNCRITANQVSSRHSPRHPLVKMLCDRHRDWLEVFLRTWRWSTDVACSICICFLAIYSILQVAKSRSLLLEHLLLSKVSWYKILSLKTI